VGEADHPRALALAFEQANAVLAGLVILEAEGIGGARVRFTLDGGRMSIASPCVLARVPVLGRHRHGFSDLLHDGGRLFLHRQVEIARVETGVGFCLFFGSGHVMSFRSGFGAHLMTRTDNWQAGKE